MGYRVKHDIGTSVSVEVLLGKDAAGNEIEQVTAPLLPGAVLPGNLSPRYKKALKDKNNPNHVHLSKLIEEYDGPDGPHTLATIENTQSIAQQQPEDAPGAPNVPGYPLSDQPSIAAQQQASGGGGAVPNAGAPGFFPAVGAYDEMDKSELETEVAKRQAEGHEINVEGSGSGGNVLVGDLRSALKADDEKQIADNPFTT